MANYCHPCQRNFDSPHSYSQHIRNSNTHRNYESSGDEYSYENEKPEYECDGCYARFGSTNAREKHHVYHHGDRYCKPCSRMFDNANQLMQHQHSKHHMGSPMECSFCPTQYPTASARTIHLESGTCSSGLNRERVKAEIRRLDRSRVITIPQVEHHFSPPFTNVASQHSWNGYSYECHLCHREFNALNGLNAHLISPVHERNMYRFHGPICAKEFKLLSGLLQHLESESCGVMRFKNVQREARGGLSNMVGKMIGN